MLRSPRGYIYTASVYAPGWYRDCICPWCIADGSAAEKFEAMFSDDHPLAQAGVPDAVIEEVTRRTPGFNSWQQEEWLSCCGDACEFHGDAPRSELQALQGELRWRGHSPLGSGESAIGRSSFSIISPAAIRQFTSSAAAIVETSSMQLISHKWPNKITGPNAGGPRQFPIRTPLAARVGQFWR